MCVQIAAGCCGEPTGGPHGGTLLLILGDHGPWAAVAPEVDTRINLPGSLPSPLSQKASSFPLQNPPLLKPCIATWHDTTIRHS
jgi:hypothetical protein